MVNHKNSRYLKEALPTICSQGECEMIRKIKRHMEKTRKRGMLMFEAVLMLATLTAVTFGMVTIMTGSFSNLAAAKSANEAQQVGEMLASSVRQVDFDDVDNDSAEVDRTLALADDVTDIPDVFVGSDEPPKGLHGKYRYTLKKIDDSTATTSDGEETKVKLMQVSVYPKDSDTVPLYTVQIPMSEAASGGDGTPIGTIIMKPTNEWKSASQKKKYLFCDGSTFSETEYPKLYKALGNSNVLPDLRNRFPEGSNGNPADPTSLENLGSTPQTLISYREAGIPNLRVWFGYIGYIDGWGYDNPSYGHVGTWYWRGPLGISWAGIDAIADFGEVGGWGSAFDACFDPSRVSSVYKDGFDTVQPASITINYFIRAK